MHNPGEIKSFCPKSSETQTVTVLHNSKNCLFVRSSNNIYYSLWKPAEQANFIKKESYL